MAAFIYLVDQIESGQVARSEMSDLEIERGAVILLLDAADRLLGIEVLGASCAARRDPGTGGPFGTVTPSRLGGPAAGGTDPTGDISAARGRR